MSDQKNDIIKELIAIDVSLTIIILILIIFIFKTCDISQQVSEISDSITAKKIIEAVEK